MIEGSRLAAIDLPLPGGPIMSTLWLPAAATSSACFSGAMAAQLSKVLALGRFGRQPAARRPAARPRAAASPPRNAASSRTVPTGITSRPPTSAASPAFVARHHDPLTPRGRGGIGHRDRARAPGAPTRPGRARRRTRDPQALRPRLPGGRQQRRREREVECRARLAQVRWSEVHRDAPQREVEPRVDERRTDALARLLHGRIAQADDRERGQPRVDVGLDRDADAVDPEQGEGGRTSQHAGNRRSRRVTAGAQKEQVAARAWNVALLRCRIDTFQWSRRASWSASMGAMAGDHRRALGRRGEDLAAIHLQRHGWRIVERNFRTREGEIDLIAARRGTLAFCEVKTLIARRAPPASGPANPVESVGPAKRTRVRRMARAWLADGREGDQDRRAPPCAARRDRGPARPRRYAAAARAPRRVRSEPLQAQGPRGAAPRFRADGRAAPTGGSSAPRTAPWSCGMGSAPRATSTSRTWASRREHRLGYEGSHWVGVRRALNRLAVTRDDVFADFGSGKGPAVLVAATFPFRRAIGVEISDDLTRSATRQPRALAPASARRQRRVHRRRRAGLRDPGRPLGGLPLQPVHGAPVRALHRATAAVAGAPSPAAATDLQLSLRARLRDRAPAASGRSTSRTATGRRGTAGRAT